MSKYADVIQNQWYYTTSKANKIACCDCGLVHEIDIKLYKKKIVWRWRRNDKSTGQIRRHMKEALLKLITHLKRVA